MDEEHKKRIAMNEATYRTVNEAVRAERAGGATTFVCECGRLGCKQLIQLSRAQYEAVHSNPRRFAIDPGHDISDVEDVVERHERYSVIEKHADTDDITKPTDPRPAVGECHPVDRRPGCGEGRRGVITNLVARRRGVHGTLSGPHG